MEFKAGKKQGSEKNSIRFKAPQCDTMTAQQISDLEKIMQTYGDAPDFAYVDDEGFRNMVFAGELENNGTSPDFVSKETSLSYLPIFETFSMLPFDQLGEKPVAEVE